ncbi:hypothetical protein GCM10008941_04480 [Rhizomicrobium palustre]
MAGTSLISLCAANPALASDILRGNPMAAPTVAVDNATASSQAAAAAATRAQNSLLRATQAVQNLRAAQDAARALVLNATSSVPNGLTTGGLEVVANPVSAANDPTGKKTWQGADAPTQSTDTSGNVSVAIKQTESKAILSWKSYNVGSKTTLTYDQQGNKDWIALNRVVGDSVAPSQILGSVKSDGTVLVINQNGIIFGGSAQINTNSLIASTLDVGRYKDGSGNAMTIPGRNLEFLNYGLLGYSDSTGATGAGTDGTFSGVKSGQSVVATGKIEVDPGASIASGDGGYILLAGSEVHNSGALTATNGQVILAAGDTLTLLRATGASDSSVPGIRGFLPYAFSDSTAGATHVAENTTTGLIQSARGSIILVSAGSSTKSATINSGGLFSTTSVSRNGAIEISGANIEIGSGSRIAILADRNDETIPQDSSSISNFKPSLVNVGNLFDVNNGGFTGSLIDIASDTLIYAPSGNISIGAASGASGKQSTSSSSRIFVDSGATIDASGLKDVLIPASRNTITISPLKGNELANSPMYKDSFLNGATVTVDPRLSGVRDDGVAWIGSPLISAQAYYQQVGVKVSELMTTGGNVALGTGYYTGSGATTTVSDVIVKKGATIDISGGWVAYQGGTVKTTQLLTSDGRIVDIGSANFSDIYTGIYTGSTEDHSHWGLSNTFSGIFQTGEKIVQTYTEGRDAGSLTIKSSAITLDGTIYADAFAGIQQKLAAAAGTASSSIYGDTRTLQAAKSQLPAGGALIIQSLALNSAVSGTYLGGADITIVADADYQALADNISYGQKAAVSADGKATIPARDTASYLTRDQLATVELSDKLLSQSGFSDVSLYTSGSVKVAKTATVTLNAGGAFNVLSGRNAKIDGVVRVPSGSIALETFDSRLTSAGGSVFSTVAATVGSFDITVNGTLSTRGLWVNDYGASDDTLLGKAWLNGGSISLYAAPHVSALNTGGRTSTDLSGSIYINTGSLVDVASGGYVNRYGSLDLTAKGGNLSLYDETAYFQLAQSGGYDIEGIVSGFRVDGLFYTGSQQYVPINPAEINARIVIDTAAIKAQGFGGGGTFTLTTPQIAFGSDLTSKATQLPLDFFSTAGFANYNITSYKTALSANPFNNGAGGTTALLDTQTLAVGAGQTLSLTQSMLPSVLTAVQATALRNLTTGGDLFSVLTASVPDNAWDAKAVNLTLGGLVELHVAKGGQITGADGVTLTVGKLLNEGTIRLAGGTIVQQLVMPNLYETEYNTTNVTVTSIGIRDFSDIFTVKADGTIDENTASKYDPTLTNAQLAGAGDTVNRHPIYRLGLLDADQGVVLASGSVTDLSGVSIRNPYAVDSKTGTQLVTGRIVAGGSLVTDPRAALNGQALFQSSRVGTTYWLLANNAVGFGVDQSGKTLTIASGAVLNLSGVSDVYDLPAAGSTLAVTTYAPTKVWSNGGALSAGAGATLTGAVIKAHGGSDEAENGTLALLNPVLVQHDPATAVANAVSVDLINSAGFDTFVAQGSINSLGDVSLDLGRAFFLQSRPLVGLSTTPGDAAVATVRAGGKLVINAPYVGLSSSMDVIANPARGTPGLGSVVFNARNIDVTGAVLFDQSVASATLNASGDVRLIGATPWQVTYGAPISAAITTLKGGIAVNGDLTINAAQIYPTTGSTIAITSTKAGGTITFGRTTTATPDAPYSAGASLVVAASNIVQGGVLRVPLGSLTLGTSSDYYGLNGSTNYVLAPATTSLELTAGSVTSVSANGLTIPYGTTTDQTEWYFSPTSGDVLSSAPAKVLTLNGTSVVVDSGSKVDISGGGDVYAYEFVPGTGGSRDVLDRYNPDIYTGNSGYQYADRRQVYAIVPGLSNNSVAAVDPIYSSDYASLSSSSGVGTRVYLSGGNGLAAGWYTLLPAKYAMLPGGMLVVEQTGAKNVVPGTNAALADGTLQVAGFYGDALSGSQSSTRRLFTVQSQSLIKSESNIAITTGNSYFGQKASDGSTVASQLPIDAGRLVINPGATLVVNSVLSTAAASGGRGAQVDITATNIDVAAALPQTTTGDSTVHVTATSLTNLHAASLLIGGTRADNADGTTTLNVSAETVRLRNGSDKPLSAGEVILAGTKSVTVEDGASISATSDLRDTRSGAYLIGSTTTSGTGALVRVANGPERLTVRTNSTGNATLAVGAATLSGSSVMLDSSGANSLSSAVAFKDTKTVALGAPRIGLGVDPASYSGLALTSALTDILNKSGAAVTLRSQSSIDLAGGSYSFGSIRLDAGALSSTDGGSVSITADSISLGNAGGGNTVCGSCAAGSGSLALSAKGIVFTDGIVATKVAATAGTTTTETNFFGGGVTLTAQNGVFARGTNGGIDTGTAALTLHTPYLGDNTPASSSTSTAVVIPSLTLTTAGNLRIDNSGGGAVSSLTAVPGMVLALNGASVAISGTTVNATAGTIAVVSASDITLSAGAMVKAPGYSKTYGDSVDSTTTNAPGGLVSLTAKQGNIDLQSGTTLSVGGGSGAGGSLKLIASKGTINLGGTIDGKAPGGGSSLALDTAGAIDLLTISGLASSSGFTAGLDVHSHSGDLVLAQGKAIRTGSLSLTADGGAVVISGTIDTSGTDGGDVSLYGTNGVSLNASAVIDAHASGYGSADTRQAEAGTVTLGTIGSGAIAIAQGAAINVAASRTGDRLVPYYTNDVKYYKYVEADLGGKVILRAPVVVQSGPDTVNVSLADASSIKGAREIDLVGVKSWDLRGLAAIANSGVTLDTASNTVTLDPRGNYLSGTTTADGIVRFVQDFDVSGAYGALGGLASSSVFHAKPGVDLAFDGNVKLDRNWNLAAGTVNVTAAVAAGVMGKETFSGSGGTSVTKYYVVPGKDAALMTDFVTMLYRTGGSVRGEAPVLSLKATGDLAINASINDGFFQFRNQTDADYLAQAVAGGAEYAVVFPSGFNYNAFLGQTLDISSYSSFVTKSAATSSSTVYVPYSSDGNSASPEKSGDPFGTAALFPRLSDNTVVQSSTLGLVAGADLVRASGVLQASVDPLAIDPSSSGTLSVGGAYSYSYGGTVQNTYYGAYFSSLLGTGNFGLSVYSQNATTAAGWQDKVLAKSGGYSYPGQNTLVYGTNKKSAVLIPNTPATNKIDTVSDLIYLNLGLTSGNTLGQGKLTSTLTNLTLRDIAKISDTTNPLYDAYLHNLYISNATAPTGGGDFFTVVSRDSTVDPYTATSSQSAFIRLVVSVKTAAYILQKYVDPITPKGGGQVTATVNSLVRTGTGDIHLAAAGNVDLTGGSTAATNVYSAGITYTAQLGGAAVYTAGYAADTALRTVLDPETGLPVTIDPSSWLKNTTQFSATPLSAYGSQLRATGFNSGVTGVLVSDDAYAEGGGDVTITAGKDVLGRTDTSAGLAIANSATATPWAGGADAPWRAGAVGSDTWAKIDHQLYRSGVGALGGGNVTVKAGRDVSDLTVTTATSMTTATTKSGIATSKALMTFGRGDVLVTAGRNILGGKIDVASGTGTVYASGDITEAGTLALPSRNGGVANISNLLELRLSDATVTVTANGSASLLGIGALGVTQQNRGGGATPELINNLNAAAFYSPNASIAITANGTVSLANSDANTLVGDTVYVTRTVYPGSLAVTSLTGDLLFGSASILMMPSQTGQLRLLAARNIAPVILAMLDADPGVLPGFYTAYGSALTLSGTGTATGGIALAFPALLPSTTSQQRALQHKAVATHQDDAEPVRIYAGNDIGSSGQGVTLSLPKQARVTAGRDIVNMMFFGQNLSASDITRIVAGRDITGTSVLRNITGSNATAAVMLGNTFVLGGPGTLSLEAGRNLGPFLNSATIGTATKSAYAGGILTVGNEWNPWLPKDGANIVALFGVAKGINYDGLRDYYLDPANLANLPDYLFEQVTVNENNGSATAQGTAADRSKPVYAPLLIAYMQANQSAALKAAYGKTDVTYAQAYTAFATLPELTQRAFLNQVYFNELKQTSIPASPSYLQYARGYRAVNLLFPASLGYTANDLTGTTNGAASLAHTGNLDFRLAAIETTRGGDISILGPGGRILAGSTVSTAAQAARRYYIANSLFSGTPVTIDSAASISAIPTGYEGVLTLRGGGISAFTDGDFLVNQSRVFTEQGGDIIMWSSNANLNAGQGAKTSANFPPVVFRISPNGYFELDQAGSTTGAGIAALQATPDSPASNIYLIAPAGTVDLGDAGVRVSGDFYVAAAHVSNADNLKVGGQTYGIPTVFVPDGGALTAASNTAAAGAQAAMPEKGNSSAVDLPSIITVEVLGYGGEPASDDDNKRRRK